MKKTLYQVLALVALVAVPMTLNAQVGEGKIFEGKITLYEGIPGAFTSDGMSYIYSRERNRDDHTTTFTIYNDELESVKSFTMASEEVFETTFMDFDQNITDWEFHLSQTIFNADEKYEAIVPLYDENSNQVGVRIVNEDGDVVQSLKFDIPNMGSLYINGPTFLKINGKYYLHFNVENRIDGKDVYYTLFYRFNPQTNEIKAVKSVPGLFTGAYSLDGRRQKKLQRGVNLVRKSDGNTRKVLVK